MRLSSLRINATTGRKLVAFAVIAAIAVGWGAVTYLNVPRMLGIGRNAVTLELPAGAGLYTNGVVTLRGVTIGQVDEVRLTPTGVEADIQVLDDHPIPVDSAVEVRSVSAVGEQYVNFEPRTTAGPFIEDGAVVPADRVVLPTTTGELLEKANALAASVPGQKLNATVDDLGKAFAGSGDDLQRLIDSLDLLTTEAQANLDPTVRLIEDAAPVLDTQNATSGDIRTYLANLASFTGRLAEADGSLRSTLGVFPPALDEVASFVKQVGDPLPQLLGNLTSVGEVTRVYVPHLQQTLTILPSMLQASIGTLSSSPVPGTIKINLQTQVNDPAPCTEGFVVDRRPPNDSSPARPPSDVRCKDADPLKAARGGKAYACPPGAPVPGGRGPDARSCGLNFQSPEEVEAARRAAIDTQMEVAGTQTTSTADNLLRSDRLPSSGPNTDPEENQPYAPGEEGYLPSDAVALDGIFLPPGSITPIVDGNQVPSSNTGWQGIVLDPLGATAPAGAGG